MNRDAKFKIIKKQVCSLLLPGYLLPVVRRKLVCHGSLGSYLGYLLDKYRYQLVGFNIAQVKTPKVCYQPEGLKLVKLNFRSEPDDWLELKLIAAAMNVSASYLFGILVKLDMDLVVDGVMGAGGKVGVPTKVKSWILHIQITPAGGNPALQKKRLRLFKT